MDPIARMVAAGAAGAGGGDPTYVDDVFSTTLYTSNASSNFDGTEQVITTGIDHTEGFLTWIKDRDTDNDHVLFDSERIGTNYKWIYSNDTHAEQDTADIFKSPTSTGFTVKAATSGSGTMRTNPTGSKSMVSWNFRKQPGFFDIQTWTGNDVAGRTISHDLGSVPGMILVKRLNDSDNWVVYHRSLGATHPAILNTEAAAEPITNRWNDTEPTSTEFTVGTWPTNGLNKTYVAYIFAHDDQSFGTNSDESIIKCGSYTGAANTVNSVELGFEPQWLMIKNTSRATDSYGSADWWMGDIMRQMTDSNARALRANSSAIEYNGGKVYPTSTGFVVDTEDNIDHSTQGDTYIYMAIRRSHKPPTAATEVFKAVQTTSAPVSIGFPTDLIISAETGSGAKYWVPRLTLGRLQTTDSSSENDVSSYFEFDLQNSFSTGSWYGSLERINYYFKRAPGFFDVVAYTGNGSTRTIPHNLGATPSVVIVKSRDAAFNWYWQHYALGANTFMQINTESQASNGTLFNSTLPTSSVFSVGDLGAINNNNDNYIAYLFGDLAGISKAGTYSGTGNNINVNCGFSAGARFVVIKRVDGNVGQTDQGDWYVWDSVRGIVGGNDPYLLLNKTSAQTTNTDYIDPLNAGFTVTSSAPVDLNAVGGTYLFLAIA